MFCSMNWHNWRGRRLLPKLSLMPPLQIPFPSLAARPFASLAAVLLAFALTALPVLAQDVDPQRCLGAAPGGPDKRIEACSALIGKSGARKDELIGFYLARGDAQREKHQLD